MIAKLVTTVLAAACLAQCAHQSEQRYLTNQDSGKVISERYYEIDGVRKVERRILVTATPRYETKLETRILGTTW
jgi:hypothetical protein